MKCKVVNCKQQNSYGFGLKLLLQFHRRRRGFRWTNTIKKVSEFREESGNFMLKYLCNDVTIKLIIENFIRFLLDEKIWAKKTTEKWDWEKECSSTTPKIPMKTGRKFSFDVKHCQSFHKKTVSFQKLYVNLPTKRVEPFARQNRLEKNSRLVQ